MLERQQFVAVGGDGRWVGSVVVLVEEAGAEGVFGGVSEVRQGHLVGVFVRHHHAVVALVVAYLGHRPGLVVDHAGAAFGPGARFTVRFPAASVNAAAPSTTSPGA